MTKLCMQKEVTVFITFPFKKCNVRSFEGFSILAINKLWAVQHSLIDLQLVFDNVRIKIGRSSPSRQALEGTWYIIARLQLDRSYI